MSWQEGAGFRIIGTIKRLFIADSGKFAKITLTVNAHPHPPELDLKSLDKILIGDMKRDLRQGQRVEFKGNIESEKVTDKARTEVKVDGYTLWIPALRPKSYAVEGSSRVPQSSGKNEKPTDREPGGDDGDPMGGADPMGGGSDPFGG